MLFAVIVMSVSLRDKEFHPSPGAHLEARRQRGHRLQLLPSTPLEEGRGGAAASPVYVGGYLQNDTQPFGKGPPVLSLP